MAGAKKLKGELSNTKRNLIISQLEKMEPSARKIDLIKVMKSFK